MNNNGNHYKFTLIAFLIGSALIDELNATEQNALGNWFMLIGQTLCTNGSTKFNRDYNNHQSQNIDANRLIRKTRDALERHIN